jgi:hypothetical protein
MLTTIAQPAYREGPMGWFLLLVLLIVAVHVLGAIFEMRAGRENPALAADQGTPVAQRSLSAVPIR